MEKCAQKNIQIAAESLRQIIVGSIERALVNVTVPVLERGFRAE